MLETHSDKLIKRFKGGRKWVLVVYDETQTYGQ